MSKTTKSTVQPGMKPTVMTIAGFDPSGGAGVLADIKTITAFGCYGVAVITSVTFQSTQGVFGARHLGREDVRSQIVPIMSDFEIEAVKVGMLPTAELVQEVAARLAGRSKPILVLDPVSVSTSGYVLVELDATALACRLLYPLAALVTPNCREAASLTGRAVDDPESMEAAGRQILDFGSGAVLVTGGDLDSEFAHDVLVDAEGATRYTVERLKSSNTHGTGCALSSAIASLLARGEPLRKAVSEAKRYVRDAIASAPGLGLGHGPLNHFPVGNKKY